MKVRCVAGMFDKAGLLTVYTDVKFVIAKEIEAHQYIRDGLHCDLKSIFRHTVTRPPAHRKEL